MASNDPPVVQAVAVSEIRGADATPLLEAIPAEAVEYSPFATTEAVAADQRRASNPADTRACRDDAGDAVRRANDIGKYEAERERALIADGNRHARVGNQYDARRTPQYREDAAYARKVAQEENEDVGDRDIAYEAVWKSTSVSCAPDNSSLSHFSMMTWPRWLRRAVTNRHPNAIEQASRRWRGGRRDGSARTRRIM